MLREAGAHADTIAEVLSLAFADDPFMRWLFQEDFDAVHRRWWQGIATRPPRGGEEWLDADLTAAALWIRADGHRDTSRSEDTAPGEGGFEQLVAELVGARAEVVMDMFARVAAAHPSDPHWYLSAVGTVPAAQGRGAGAALLAPMLARCDASGSPAYLESSNPRNITFYERLGFEKSGEIVSADGGAHLTAMWRDPM